MNAILTMAIVVYVALIALLTALPARKRHWSMVLLRTGVIGASAIVSVPLSKLIADEIGQRLYGVVEPRLPADLQTFMGEVPLVAESAQLIVSLLIAPLLFLVLFLVLRAVLCLIVWIVERVVPALRERSLRNSAIAVPIGAVNGILVALVTLITLCGYVALSTDAISLLGDQAEPLQEEILAPAPEHIRVDALSYEIETPETTEDIQVVLDVSEEIGDNPLISVLNTVGTPLFHEMTSGTLEDGSIEFVLAEELPHLTESAGQLVDALERFEDEDVTKEDTEALMSAVQNLLSSDWVAEVAADSVSFIAETWQDGEAFMGMEAPQVGGMLQPVLDTALTVLSTESAENLRADVETVLTVMSDLMAAGLLSDDPDYQSMLEELGKDGLISRLMETLNANPHMAPLAEELKAVSVKIVSSVLGETLKNTEEYDPLIENVAGQLTDVIHMSKEERDPIVRDAVKSAFEEYGVTVPEDVAVEFSEKALAEVGEDGTVDADELKQYLIDNIDEGMELGDDIFGDEDIDIPDIGL